MSVVWNNHGCTRTRHVVVGIHMMDDNSSFDVVYHHMNIVVVYCLHFQDLEGLQGDKKSPDKFRRPVLSPHLHTSNLFPPATWREFILRSSTPSPSPHSQLSPQRMFCVLHRGVEFRIAGGFSSDTNLF